MRDFPVMCSTIPTAAHRCDGACLGHSQFCSQYQIVIWRSYPGTPRSLHNYLWAECDLRIMNRFTSRPTCWFYRKSRHLWGKFSGEGRRNILERILETPWIQKSLCVKCTAILLWPSLDTSALLRGVGRGCKLLSLDSPPTIVPDNITSSLYIIKVLKVSAGLT
jgi:hypothetical protein